MDTNQNQDGAIAIVNDQTVKEAENEHSKVPKVIEDEKDGDWEFPENVKFPLVAKVLVKFYKVAENTDNSETKYKLLTKNVKAEVMLEKGDLANKNKLERMKDIARENGLENPQMELFSMRKDSQETFKTTKMTFIAKRMVQFQNKEDLFLVEVKEKILRFQAGSPTIKIVINNNAPSAHVSKRMKVLEIEKLNNILKEHENSKFDPVQDRIFCGKCEKTVKPREKGASKSVAKYFFDMHFVKCGSGNLKRKLAEETKTQEDDKKKREVATNKEKWRGFVAKAQEKEAKKTEAMEIDDEDFIDDPDLVNDTPNEAGTGDGSNNSG